MQQSSFIATPAALAPSALSRLCHARHPTRFVYDPGGYVGNARFLGVAVAILPRETRLRHLTFIPSLFHSAQGQLCFLQLC